MAFVFNKSSPATAGEAGFNLKACLKAAGWPAQSSGDGTTYFTASDGITHGGAGAGGMGNSRAWWRLRDPAGVVEIIYQRGSSGNIYVDFWISPSARFTGGAPNATTIPTARRDDEPDRAIGLVGSPPGINSKDEIFPIPWAIQNGGTSPGWKGVGTVMKWCGTTRATGDTLNIAGTRDHIVYRNVALPWDGSVPSV